MSEKPDNHSKKSGDGAGRRVLQVLFTLFVICVAAVVVYALKVGVATPSSNVGVVQSRATEPPATTEEPTEPTTQTEEPTEEPTEETEPEDPVLAKAEAALASMTAEEKVYQLFCVSVEDLAGVYGQQTADDTLRGALQAMPVGGVVIDRQNVSGTGQVSALVSDLQEASRLPLLMGVEEEDGFNSALNGIGATAIYDQMMVYGDEYNTQRVYEIGQEIGTAITALGIHMDFAPVADTLTNIYNTEVGRRSFSAEASVVAAMVPQEVNGLHDGGALSCIKYFPGLASTAADSRYGAVSSERTLEELRAAEFTGFQAGIDAGADLVMVAHLSFPNVTGDDTPASQSSYFVTDLLRGELGFQGVIITDSQQKGAIAYNFGAEAAVKALQAGCDMIYRPEDLPAAAQAVLDALENGELTQERIDESVLRILTLKYGAGLE